MKPKTSSKGASGTQHLGSANRIVWNYFEALRRLAARTKKMDDTDERKQDVALCIVLSVTAVEAFVNVYFRVVVSEAAFAKHLPKFEADLKSHIPLAEKLKQWPKLMFGKGLDMGSGPCKAFKHLTAHRHKLIHFKSSHQSVTFGAVSIHGLADMSAFDTLTPTDAKNALSIAEDVLAEVFLLQGIAKDQVPHMLHGWTGKLPTLSALKALTKAP